MYQIILNDGDVYIYYPEKRPSNTTHYPAEYYYSDGGNERSSCRFRHVKPREEYESIDYSYRRHIRRYDAVERSRRVGVDPVSYRLWRILRHWTKGVLLGVDNGRPEFEEIDYLLSCWLLCFLESVLANFRTPWLLRYPRSFFWILVYI